ncbi:amidase [Variovorax terrae]|uniref:Amidase n=1 Tax=Variovorax terrae TaxID=2923278 RepID=A0A9X1VXJ8_9BURK|nr:amidase [Variovorax terrae]MCJ0765616.1 amidase [Variovorax terrae]
MTPANHLSALDAARAIEAGTLSSEALVRACLARIAERNADVRAFTAVDEATALQHAREADRAATGPLRGLPFAVKDVIETADYPTAYGSPIYAGHRPRLDAACVASARERGAVVLGKLATSEFATQTPSDTRNPLNLGHTPGGSSSGSAAAVADFMVPVAFGTQTTASIVRPAAYCGVVGYKPTFGFFNSAGLKPLSPGQDTLGLLARSVADAAFFGFGLHGARLADTPDLRPRLAVCQSRQWAHARPEMAQAIEQLAADAERQGASVQRITLPADIEDLVEMQARLFAFEARQSLAHERLHHSAQFSPRLQRRLDGGLGITPQDYLEMRRRAARGRRQIQALFADVDALLYPPAEGEADAGLADSGSPRFGALWSLLHLPCVSLPIARGPHGLPLGTQVIGAYGDDARLLAVAGFVSRAAAARWNGG